MKCNYKKERNNLHDIQSELTHDSGPDEEAHHDTYQGVASLKKSKPYLGIRVNEQLYIKVVFHMLGLILLSLYILYSTTYSLIIYDGKSCAIKTSL